MCSGLYGNIKKITFTIIKTGQGVATLLCAFNTQITVFFILVIFKGDNKIEQVKRLLEYLYADSELHIERKYSAYLYICKGKSLSV